MVPATPTGRGTAPSLPLGNRCGGEREMHLRSTLSPRDRSWCPASGLCRQLPAGIHGCSVFVRALSALVAGTRRSQGQQQRYGHARVGQRSSGAPVLCPCGLSVPPSLAELVPPGVLFDCDPNPPVTDRSWSHSRISRKPSSRRTRQPSRSGLPSARASVSQSWNEGRNGGDLNLWAFWLFVGRPQEGQRPVE